MDRPVLLWVVALLACGPNAAPSTGFTLQVGTAGMSSGDGSVPTLVLQGGETRTVQLLVVGTTAGPVTFAATGLPAFATFQAPFLFLAPQRSDAGDYMIQLSATSGDETENVALKLVVEAPNRPPVWLRSPGVGMGFCFTDESGDREFVCPVPTWCTAIGTPRLQLFVTDPDGDPLTVEAEVVPRGTPFSRHASYTATSPAFDLSTWYWAPIDFLYFTGLTVERSYDFSMRLTDQFGAPAVQPGFTDADGWTTGDFGFDQGPCTTRVCACRPTIAGSSFNFCAADADCCSGTCVGDWMGYCL